MPPEPSRSQQGRPEARSLVGTVRAFCADEAGATSIEYSLICALIFLVITTSVGLFANNTGNMYNRIQRAMP